MVVMASVIGAGLALLLVSFAVLYLTDATRDAAMIGVRVGGLAMLVPSIWFAIFLGAPLVGGIFIGLVGEAGASLGACLGFAASIFLGFLVGAVVGALLASTFQCLRRARSAA